MLDLRWEAPTLKRALLLGVLSFAVVVGAAIATAIFAPLVAGVMAGGVVGALILVPALLRSGPIGAIGPALGIGAAALGAFFIAQPAKALLGEHAPGIRVEEAIQRPQVTLFSFTDGTLRLELRGEHQVDTENSHYTLHAAPVVPEGWSREQPVLLWACSRSATGDGAWQAAHRRGYRMPEEDEGDCRKAAAAAATAAGLRTPADAAIIVWSADPEGECWRALLTGVLFTALPLLLLLVGLPLVYPRLKKLRPYQAGASPRAG